MSNLAAALLFATAADNGQPASVFFAAAVNSSKQLLAMLECKDEEAGCASWAAGGECRNNPGFMHASCRKSCGRCDLSGEDASHALEIAAYAARNEHGGCTNRRDAPPVCDDSRDRLAAVLAVAREGGRGSGLQRFLEALAHEILAVGAKAALSATGVVKPPAVTAGAQAAASVGGGGERGDLVTLSDGGTMPAVGLGTWLTVGQACYDMVRSGLRAGLRHIDTSENYANHEEIGRALADSGVPRAELFLADKLSFTTSYSAEGARAALGDSLRKLGTEYLDLYMLHSVGPSKAARHAAWREMAALQKEGKIRHIGVSNFGGAELRELKQAFPEAPPVTLQSKFNPYHRGRTGNAGGEDFYGVAAELGVAITAYCPLNDWPSKMKAVDDAHVATIAERVGKTPAQVILRWGVQLGLTLLTRSGKEARLREATQLFDFALGEGDMALISGLAHFVQSPTNRVPDSVADAFGVRALDAGASSHPPAAKPAAAAPIKACDMAAAMLGGGRAAGGLQTEL